MMNPANSDKLNILVFPGAKCERLAAHDLDCTESGRPRVEEGTASEN